MRKLDYGFKVFQSINNREPGKRFLQFCHIYGNLNIVSTKLR